MESPGIGGDTILLLKPVKDTILGRKHYCWAGLFAKKGFGTFFFKRDFDFGQRPFKPVTASG